MKSSTQLTLDGQLQLYLFIPNGLSNCLLHSWNKFIVILMQFKLSHPIHVDVLLQVLHSTPLCTLHPLLRTHSHKLGVEVPSWHHHRSMKICKVCNEELVADECHLLIKCSTYKVMMAC